MDYEKSYTALHILWLPIFWAIPAIVTEQMAMIFYDEKKRSILKSLFITEGKLKILVISSDIGFLITLGSLSFRAISTGQTSILEGTHRLSGDGSIITKINDPFLYYIIVGTTVFTVLLSTARIISNLLVKTPNNIVQENRSR